MNRLLLMVGITGVLFSCNSDPEIPAPEYKNPFFEMPEEKYGGLYRELQLYEAVPAKDFADAVPLREPRDIYNDLRRAKNDYDFDMEKFLHENFSIPERKTEYSIDSTRSIEESIVLLWEAWDRPADSGYDEGSSLIPLRYPYVVSTDISNDIVYWDAYFTIIGLIENGEIDKVENMVKNFSDLIGRFGFIPYNNRTYNTTRSQIPFFAEMVDQLAQHSEKEVWREYVDDVEKEYQYWMRYEEDLTTENPDSAHVVSYRGKILNRFWDENTTPRPEFYISDDRSSNNDWRPKWQTLREYRTITESGWNYGSRYMSNGRWRGSTNATSIIPIDLNSVLYYYEHKLSEVYENLNQSENADMFAQRAAERKEAIESIFWDPEAGIYKDIHYIDSTLTDRNTIATIFPLYYGISDQEKAGKVASFIENKLLKEGGVMNSTHFVRQRWDAPNGWAQMQWFAYQGLKNYDYHELANKIASRWIKTVERTYQNTYRFSEYYNVEDIRDNFDDTRDTLNYAWTVAVYEQFKSDLD